MSWLSGLCRLSVTQWGHQLTIRQAAYSDGFRIFSYLTEVSSIPHATIGSSPAKLFLQRELRTRLSPVTPDTGSRVASQQHKMKSNRDKVAQYREIAVGDSVLARDHLSGQKWQAGTVVQQTSPASFQVQLNDGQNWRRHADDVLQNTSSSSIKVTSDQSTEAITSPSTESSTPPPEESESVESPSTPTPPTPAPRRSKRSIKPPQRLIEEMD